MRHPRALQPGAAGAADRYPFYAASGKGAHFTDVDGNEFIDYMCAYGPMVLGYDNQVVHDAAARQRKLGDTLGCPSPVMVELAEKLASMIAGADWAFFAKNGGDVTNYATMIARAATGRPMIVAIEGGYHGVAPWMQGARPPRRHRRRRRPASCASRGTTPAPSSACSTSTPARSPGSSPRRTTTRPSPTASCRPRATGGASASSATSTASCSSSTTCAAASGSACAAPPTSSASRPTSPASARRSPTAIRSRRSSAPRR